MKRQDSSNEKGKGMPEHLKGKCKPFTSEYQPSPEAKSRGIRAKQARNVVFNTLMEEVAEEMVIALGGKKVKVTTLKAMLKKLIQTGFKNEKALMRIVNMMLEYENRNTATEQRQQIIDSKNIDDTDQEISNSFIEALGGQASEVWKE